MLKRYVVLLFAFYWSVLTGMWIASSRIVGDTLQRWKSVRLKGELEKQKIALGENLFSSGAGDAGLRQRISAKNHEIQLAESNKTSTATLIAERREIFSALGSSALESADTSDRTKDIRTAQDALDDHEQQLSQLFATRPPIKKRAWVGLGLLSLAFLSALVEPSNEIQRSTENSARNDQQVADESVAGSDPQAAGSENTGNRGGSARVAKKTGVEERYESLVIRVKPGMSRNQVEAILGLADKETENDLGELNPAKSGQTLTILTWDGNVESDPSIVLGFINGRLSDGGTPGYDINKGFVSELPSNMSDDERTKLKDAMRKLGIHAKD